MDPGHAFLFGAAIGLVLGVLIAAALQSDNPDPPNPFDNGWPY